MKTELNLITEVHLKIFYKRLISARELHLSKITWVWVSLPAPTTEFQGISHVLVQALEQLPM